MNEKKVPNPWGKKGGKEHRKLVEETAAEIIENGNLFDREAYVQTPNGKKRGRFADLAEIDKVSGDIIAYYQIGIGKKNTEPVAREQEAKTDIENASGIRTIFKPYNLLIFAVIILTGAFLTEIL